MSNRTLPPTAQELDETITALLAGCHDDGRVNTPTHEEIHIDACIQCTLPTDADDPFYLRTGLCYTCRRNHG
jgi:hypothetical protein